MNALNNLSLNTECASCDRPACAGRIMLTEPSRMEIWNIGRATFAIGAATRSISVDVSSTITAGWEQEQKLFLCLADGLGSSKSAREAAQAVITGAKNHPPAPLPAILAHCNQLAANTCGVAMGIAVIEPVAQTISFCGVGNVRALLSSRNSHRFSCSDGAVGTGFANLLVETLPFLPGDTLILTSGGVQAQFTVPELGFGTPWTASGLADAILEQQSTNDASVLICRSLTPWAQATMSVSNSTPLGTEYARLLQEYWLYGGEEPIIQAADLGKKLVHDNIPPKDISGLQLQALTALGRDLPPTRLDTVAMQITPLLTAMLNAYGLAFHEQVQQHYQHLVEKRLEQDHRMEALGTLAAGIAHDFNTILGVILGYAEMTLSMELGDASIRSNLQHIITAALRARDLVARVLSFGRRDEAYRIPVRLADVVKESLEMLGLTLPPGVVFNTERMHPTLTIMADPGEMQQLVVDLTTNAIDAMAGRGVITFTIDTMTFNDVNPPLPKLSIGNYVLFSIRDTGCGITPAVIDRIFEPFFTTKEVGKGTGLGLSVVYGIVQRMGGVVKVRSEPDRGTEFEMFFPRFVDLLTA